MANDRREIKTEKQHKFKTNLNINKFIQIIVCIYILAKTKKSAQTEYVTEISRVFAGTLINFGRFPLVHRWQKVFEFFFLFLFLLPLHISRLR